MSWEDLIKKRQENKIKTETELEETKTDTSNSWENLMSKRNKPTWGSSATETDLSADMDIAPNIEVPTQTTPLGRKPEFTREKGEGIPSLSTEEILGGTGKIRAETWQERFQRGTEDREEVVKSAIYGLGTGLGAGTATNLAKRFAAGLGEKVEPVDEQKAFAYFMDKRQDFEPEKSQKVGRKIGEIAGTMVKYGTGYALGGPAIEGAVKGSELLAGASPLAKTFVAEVAKDAAIGELAIGLPSQVASQFGKGHTLPESISNAVKNLPEQLGFDIASNLLFGGLGKAFGKGGDVVAESAGTSLSDLVPAHETTEKISESLGRFLDGDELLSMGYDSKTLKQVDELGEKIAEFAKTSNKINDMKDKVSSTVKSLGYGEDLTVEKVLKDPQLRNIFDVKDNVKNIVEDIKSLEDKIELKPQPPINGKTVDVSAISPLAVADGIEKQRQFSAFIGKSEVVTAKEVQDLVKEADNSFTSVTNAGREAQAKEIVSKNFDAARNYITEGKKVESSLDPFIAKEVFEQLQDAGRWDDAFNVVEAIGRKATGTAQSLQAYSIWRKTTPEGMVKFVDTIERKFKTAGHDVEFSSDFKKEVFDRMETINKFPQPVDESVIKSQIQNATDQVEKSKLTEQLSEVMSQNKKLNREKDIAIAEVLRDIYAQKPVSFWRKVSTFQVMEQLLNPGTMGRNVLGNAAFMELENLNKNLVARPLDALVGKITGQRTIGKGASLKSQYEAGKERAKEAIEEVSKGIDVGRAQKFQQFSGRTFDPETQPILSNLEKMLGYGLKVPDEFFKGMIYQNTAEELAKLTKTSVDQLPAGIKEMAENQALYATFQDDSLPAQMLTGLKETLNKAGVGETLSGKAVRQTKEFGVGDFTVKYTGVPGNIISRGIEYSPVGYLKAFYNLAALKNTKNLKKQREAVLQLSRATTGTGLAALGFWLRDKGAIVTQDYDRDKKAVAMDVAEGKSGYKINIDAIGRILQGQTGKLQKGDTFADFKWLQPINAPIATGAAINAVMQSKKANRSVVKDITNASMGELIDIPSLMMVKQMVYAGQKEGGGLIDVLNVPLDNALSGFMPSSLRKISYGLDPQMRETRGLPLTEAIGEGDLTKSTAFRKIQAGIPGAREKLEPRIDQFGNIKRIESNVLGSLVLPSQPTKYNPTATSNFLRELEEKTGDANIYPSSIKTKNFKNGENTIKMSDREQTQYAQYKGQFIKKNFNGIMDVTLNRFGSVQNLDSEQSEALAKEFVDIKRYANKFAQNKILQGRGIIPKP